LNLDRVVFQTGYTGCVLSFIPVHPVILSRIKKPQMIAPRVTPLEGVYTYALRGIRGCGVEKPQGFGIDERRLIAFYHRKGREERKAERLKCLYLDSNHPTGNTDFTDCADFHGYDCTELVRTETNSSYSNFGG